MNKKIMGALLVTMAASASMAIHHEEKKADGTTVKNAMACQNNTCKGKADCVGFGNASCHGVNACKGQGIKIVKNKAECEKKHGTWTTFKK